MALLLSLAAVLFCGLMTPRQSGCAHKDTATIPLVLITAVIINNIPLIGKLAHGAPGPLRLCPAGRLRPGPARRRPGPRGARLWAVGAGPEPSPGPRRGPALPLRGWGSLMVGWVPGAAWHGLERSAQRPLWDCRARLCQRRAGIF